jgi:hypothetical protein
MGWAYCGWDGSGSGARRLGSVCDWLELGWRGRAGFRTRGGSRRLGGGRVDADEEASVYCVYHLFEVDVCHPAALARLRQVVGDLLQELLVCAVLLGYTSDEAVSNGQRIHGELGGRSVQPR